MLWCGFGAGKDATDQKRNSATCENCPESTLPQAKPPSCPQSHNNIINRGYGAGLGPGGAPEYGGASDKPPCWLK